MRRTIRWSVVAVVSLGSVVFQGCPIDLLGGLLSNCLGGDTISEREYDDLNILEQLLYEENDCDRYERR